MTRGVLYVIACAAGPAREVSRLVTAAQREGWDTCLLATPAAVRFLDVAALEALTGHPVRSEYKHQSGKLRSWGVTVLYGPDVYELHAAGTGGAFIGSFPWTMTLEALRDRQHA